MSGLHPPTPLLNLPRPALKVEVHSPRVLAKTQQGWPLDVVPLCPPNLLPFQVCASILILFRFFLIHTHSSLKLVFSASSGFGKLNFPLRFIYHPPVPTKGSNQSHKSKSSAGD